MILVFGILEVSNELDEFCQVYVFFDQVVVRYVFDDSMCWYLVLIVEELFFNIVFYGYLGGEIDMIKIIVLWVLDLIILVLEDGGVFFDIGVQLYVDLMVIVVEDMIVGGFGFFFVYQVLEVVIYECKGGCNIICVCLC